MAKLKSFIKLEGTLDGLTFYKSKDGYMVKTKGGVSKSRIMKDPAFKRTRENLSEFGLNARAGKLIRQSIGHMLSKGKDAKLSSRMMQLMNALKNLDTTSSRGERSAGIGINTVEGKGILKGFNFNERAHLQAVLNTVFTISTTTGEIVFPNLNPAEAIIAPESATHFQLSTAMVKIDFENGIFTNGFSEPIALALNSETTTIQLSPPEVTGDGVQLHVLLIEFFQEVNGTLYALHNGNYNVLSIVEVV